MYIGYPSSKLRLKVILMFLPVVSRPATAVRLLRPILELARSEASPGPRHGDICQLREEPGRQGSQGKGTNSSHTVSYLQYSFSQV